MLTNQSTKFQFEPKWLGFTVLCNYTHPHPKQSEVIYRSMRFSIWIWLHLEAVC